MNQISDHRDTAKWTVQVTGMTEEELLEELKRHSISVNDYAKQLFRFIKFTEHSLEFEAVVVTAEQLGFPDGATWAPLIERAAEHGLGLCPLEAAPYLRLQFLDQQEGPWITIASEKPTDDPDDPNGFYLRRLDDGLWLRGYRASADHLWKPQEKFLFRQQD